MKCYNCGLYLKEAIESVLSQTYNNWEIVFWDNHSTDNSRDVFDSYDDSRFKYFLADKHTVVGEARNLAIKQAKGDLIAFLDCDDIWLPEKLEKQVPLFEKETVGLVICDSMFFNNNNKELRQLYKEKKPPTGLVFKELLGDYFISLETAVIRKSLLDGMDEWFDPRFEVIEEYDFFVRVGFEWELEYVDAVLAKWRVHGSSLTWNKTELFPAETRMFLDKLRIIIPDFDTVYCSEIYEVTARIAFQEAILAWECGDSKLARKILKPYRREKVNALIVTIWTLVLPFRTFNFINKFRNGLI